MNIRSVLKGTLFGKRKSSLASRLARGAFWPLIATVAYRGATLTSSVVVARFLGKEEFGKFGIIQSTVTMFLVFTGAGLGLTSTRFVSQFRTKAPDSAGGVIGVSLIFSFIGGLVAAMGLFLLSSLNDVDIRKSGYWYGDGYRYGYGYGYGQDSKVDAASQSEA